DAGLAKAAIELRDVALEGRLEIGVYDGRAQPVVLADLRQHLGRERDAAIGYSLEHDLTHARFVLRMQKRKQQTYRNRFDVLRGELAHRLTQRRLIEFLEHIAAEVDALLHFAGQALRHQRLW